MKQLTILISAIIFGIGINAGNSEAQSIDNLKNATPERRAKTLTDTLKTILHLNTDQYSKVYNINLDIAKQTIAIQQGDDNKYSKYKAIKAVQDKRDEALKPVLTSEQYKVYEDKKDEIMSEMKKKYKDSKA